MEVLIEPTATSSTTEEPIKLIKVRKGLEEYFEIISHKDKTLKCKLAGKDHCKIDGVTAKLVYCERRGWFNFERHMRGVHRVLEPKIPLRQTVNKTLKQGKITRTRKNKLVKSADCKTTVKSKTVTVDSLEENWRNLYSNEKYCLMCLDVCIATTDKERVTEEGILRRVFSGCEGSTRLSQQLFYIFFLRNIVNFPAERCQELLKKCRGQRMPDTWFSLCSVCRELVLQAAAINEQLISLENRILKLKAQVRSKFQENANNSSAINLSKIETEIRSHILDAEGVNLNFTNDTEFDYSFDDVLIPDDSFDENRIEQIIKIENNCDDDVSNVSVTVTDDSSYVVSRRKRSRPNYREIEDDQQDEAKTCTSSCSLAIVKVEQETLKECEDLDAVKVMSAVGQNADLPVTIEDTAENNDSDFEATPSDMLEAEDNSESSDGTYLPSKGSFKSKRRKLGQSTKQSDIVKKLTAKSKASGSRRYKSIIGRKTELHMCQFCPSKYISIRSLQEHLEVHEISKTQNNQYDCQKCGFPCHSEKNRELHIKIKHSSKGELRCTLCDNVSSSQRQFSRHLQDHREEAERERVDGKYFCKLCNRVFISFDVLCKHKRTIHYQEIGVDPIRCEHCNLICSTKRLLQDHIQQTHKKQSKYFCELCGKGMLYMSKLRRHMNCHLKERVFVCEVCGADFYYKETLKDHVKKEHSSDTGEDTTGKFSESVPVSENRYTCKQCGMCLASATLLNRHIKTHQELYLNDCDLCGKRYATPQSLRRHKEINHSKRQVSCTFCGKMFSHKEYIRGHYKYCKKYPNQEKKIASALTGEPLHTYTLPEFKVGTENERSLFQEAHTSS